MTVEQRLDELRKALAQDGELARLLVDVAKDFADIALRRQYDTNDPSALIRQAGVAEGAERFTREITKSPKVAHSDRLA